MLLQSLFLLTDSKGSLAPWLGAPSAFGFPTLVLVPVGAILAPYSSPGGEEFHQEGEAMGTLKEGLCL